MNRETPFDPQKHAEVPGGFVEKEALETEIEALKIAKIAESLGGKKATREEVMNLLHAEALDEDKQRDKDLKIGGDLLVRLQEEEIGPNEFWTGLPASLKESKRFMLKALAVYGELLEEASSKLRSDPEVVLQAVKENGNAIEFAEGEAKKDRAIVREAVARDGYVLKKLDEEFKSDREIVLVAVKNFAYAIEYASPELQKDREVVLEAVKNYPAVLEKIDPQFLKDKEVVMAAVSKDGEALRYVPWGRGELSLDLDVVSAAMRNDPRALMWAHPSVKKKIQEAMGITDQQIEAERLRQIGLQVELRDRRPN